MMTLREKAIWIPAIALVLVGIITVVGNVIIEYDRDPTFAMEQQTLIEVLATLSGDERSTRLCEFHHSNLFQSQRVIVTLAEMVARDPKCTADGYLPHMPVVPIDVRSAIEDDTARARLDECLQQYSTVTASCQAYDKAGFHGRPGDSCGLSLDAGEGRFFAQESVTVLSESYRKRRGAAARESMKPTKSNDDLIRSFNGSIGCTNDRGTGRTCSARATVRALAYPDSCSPLRNLLQSARQAKG